MKNDFVTMFSALSTAEQEDFGKYISYFYEPQKVILSTFEKAEKAIVKQEEKTFLLSIKNDKKTLNDLSDLKKWLLEFLTLQEVKNNSYETQFLTLEALRKRGLTNVLAKKTKDLNKNLTENTSLNIWQTLMKLRLDHEAYFNTQNDKLDNYQTDIEHLLNNLDSFYIGTKLKYSAELYSRTSILQEKYEPKLLNEILSLINTDTSFSPIIYELYLPLLELTRDKSEVAYEVLKAFLLKNKPYNRTEKLSILLYLFNFAAYKIRQGDTIFQEEYFKLAQIGVEQSLFNAVGYFPTQTFNNIVNVGSFMKEYTWTEKFIRDWSIHLNPDDKHIARNLALARLYFEEKKFEKSDALLQELVHYKNSHFAVSIRTLLARVYYEQKTALSMQNNYCDALELYIRRIKNTNETYRKEALNFVKILRLLINERPKKQILNIINTLEVQKEPLMYVTWIKAKTDELHN